MDNMYMILGMIVFWATTIIASVVCIWWLFNQIVNWLGNKFKTLWVVVDYARHRKEFKKWLSENKTMKNTLESAIAFIKSRPHYKAVIADPIIVDQAAKDLFDYANSVRPEVVVPKPDPSNPETVYWNGVKDGYNMAIDEIKRLNPALTFTELNHTAPTGDKSDEG